MPDTKMLQMILDRVIAVDKKVESLEKKTDKGFKGVHKRIDEAINRIDKLGLQLAELSDDAPAMEEFEALEQRVEKLEHQIATA